MVFYYVVRFQKNVPMKWFHLEIFLNNILRLQSISIFIIILFLVVMGKRIRLP